MGYFQLRGGASSRGARKLFGSIPKFPPKLTSRNVIAFLHTSHIHLITVKYIIGCDYHQTSRTMKVPVYKFRRIEFPIDFFRKLV
jgi:hypothetical protein